MSNKAAIAIGAHPDDIEFYMAGTLLQLKKSGCENRCELVSRFWSGPIGPRRPKLAAMGQQ